MTARKSLWGLMVFLSAAIALVSWRFAFDAGAFAGSGMEHFRLNLPVTAYMHFLLGPIALLTGGFQLSTRLRSKWPVLHRAVGWIYTVTCLLAAIAAFVLAVNTESGPMVASGFGTLAVIWFYTTARAIWEVAQGNYLAHRAWMIRSFTLTFTGGVLFRLIFLWLFATVFGWDYATWYSIGSWLSWLPGLLAVNWWLNRKPDAKPQVAAA